MANPPPPTGSYAAICTRLGIADGAVITAAILNQLAQYLVAQDGNGNVQEIVTLRIGAYGFLCVDINTNIWITQNAYTVDGTNWYPFLDNVGSSGIMLDNGNYGIFFYIAPAVGGAGALTWAQAGNFSATGLSNLAAILSDIATLNSEYSALSTTVSSFSFALAAETSRAEASEQGIVSLVANDGYAWAEDAPFQGGFFDAAGNPVLGLTAANSISGSVGDNIPVASAFVWADESPFYPGAAMTPQEPQGGLRLTDRTGNIIYPYGTALDDYAPYIGADGNVYTTNNDDGLPTQPVHIAAPLGFVRGEPVSKGKCIYWVDDSTALSVGSPATALLYPERRIFNYHGGDYLVNLGGITKLVQIIDMGGSYTIGKTAGLLTTSPPFARACMFNGGPKVRQEFTTQGWGSPGELCADKQILSLREFYEYQLDTTYAQGETHMGGCAWWFGQGSNLGATEAVVLSSIGEGGATLGKLQTGFCYYNCLRLVERGAAIAALNGWGYEVYLTMLSGGNDYSTAAATFQSELTAMQASLETAIKAIFSANGWSPPAHVPFFCLQPQAWTDPDYGLTTAPSMYIFPALFRSNPNQFVCVGPLYYTDLFTPDNTHKTAPGYKLDGEYYARAVMRYRASAVPEGLYATGVSNSGTTLTITTSGASALVIDTSVVTDPGQYGLYCYDQTAGAVVALSGITIPGGAPTTIQATMATKTTGHVYLIGIADRGVVNGTSWPGPTTGVRACIRDSSTDISSADTNATPMYNYMVSDELTFTAV